MDPSVLARKQLPELKGIAAHLEMRGYQRLKKAELIDAIVQAARSGQIGTPANGSVAAAESSGPAPQDNGSEPAQGEQQRVRRRGEGNGQDSEEGRTRVRTRNRERTAEVRDDVDGMTGTRGSEDHAPAATVARPVEREAEAPRDLPRPPASDHADGGYLREDDESGGRRRRSRRERRRNKGGQGQPQGQGPAQGAPQGAPAQPPPQASRSRDRDDEPAGEAAGEVRSGILDILPEGYGFMRTSGYLPGDRDVYVSQGQIRRHGLRRGDVVEGPVRMQRNNEKVPGLHHVARLNGADLDQSGPAPQRPDFKDMTPLFPDERLNLETPDGPISMRIIDLMAPIGKGQRGLIVSPPKAGKTTILKELGQAIAANNPEVHLMVVLVDERPEEVTDMQRSIPGEVIASTFDRPADDHTQIAELAIERAKRLVEMGRDVVILLDSITRLSRAYNLAAPASGRIMSGGVDSSALYPPKRFFGAARNIEDGGSLTIIASALIETGSKMDEVIFEEFKGTGNMELRLDRRLEQKRIFPAIDLESSGTRKEELLIDREELAIIWKLRRVLHALDGPAALELLIDKMKSTKSNNGFLVQIQKTNLSAP